MSKFEESPSTKDDRGPDTPSTESRDAEDTLRRYLTVVRHIFEHVQAKDPKILTELRRRARLRMEKAHR